MSLVKWKMVTTSARSTRSVRERERLGIATSEGHWTIIDERLKERS